MRVIALMLFLVAAFFGCRSAFLGQTGDLDYQERIEAKRFEEFMSQPGLSEQIKKIHRQMVDFDAEFRKRERRERWTQAQLSFFLAALYLVLSFGFFMAESGVHKRAAVAPDLQPLLALPRSANLRRTKPSLAGASTARANRLEIARLAVRERLSKIFGPLP